MISPNMLRAACALVVSISSVPPLPAQDGGGQAGRERADPAPAAVVQAKVREWVRTQRLISEEKADWEAEKEALADLNALRRREIEKLDELISAAGNRLAEAEQQRRDLRAMMESLQADRERLETVVAAAEQSLRSVVSGLPHPLRVELSDTLGGLDADRGDLPLQVRYRDLVTLLGEINAFRNRITVSTELREFDGRQVEVEVVYLGLGAAWYVDRAGSRAGRGKAAAEGWTWTREDSLARRVRQAIDVHRKEAPPALISLPLQASPNPAGS